MDDPINDERIAEIRKAARPGHASILAQLIKHGAHTLPEHDEPVIIHGCTVIPAATLKEAVRAVWFGTPEVLDEVARLRSELTRARALLDTALRLRMHGAAYDPEWMTWDRATERLLRGSETEAP